jgi:transcriptional regulator with XRE-family HTH domain
VLRQFVLKGGDSVNVGSNIRTIREHHGLTLEQVGKCLGTPKEFVFQLEKGLRTPNINQLISICEILSCTPNDVLGFNKLKEDKND